MSPRGAALVVVVLLLGLGGLAGWLVGVPTPVVALVAGLAFGVALRRMRKPRPTSATQEPKRDESSVGGA